MRLSHALVVIGVILWHIACLPASAATDDADMPLRVKQASSLPASTLPATPPKQVAIHDIKIGEASVPVRLGFSPQSETRLLDVSGINTWLEASIEQRGNLIVYDRPDSNVRAELDLSSGALWTDGAKTGQIELSAVRSGERLWLGEAALEGLLGHTVDVPPETAPVTHRQERQGKARNGSAFLPVSGVPLEAPQKGRFQARSLPERTLQPRSLGGAGFGGVFDQRIKTPADNTGRVDWRSAGSWRIERSQVTERDTTHDLPAMDIARVQPVSYEKRTARKLEVSPVGEKQQGDPTNNSEKFEAGADTARPKLIKAVYEASHWGEAGKVEPDVAFVPSSSAFAKSLDELVAPEPSAKAAAGKTTPYRGAAVLYDRPVKPAYVAIDKLAQEAPEAPQSTIGDEVRPTGAQLQGTAFLDMDGDGRPGLGDQLLEGEIFQLLDLDGMVVAEQRTAVFGQIGVNDLAPGQYRLNITMGWEAHSVQIDVPGGQSVLNVQVAIPVDIPKAEPVELQLAAGTGAIEKRCFR